MTACGLQAKTYCLDGAFTLVRALNSFDTLALHARPE